MSGLNRTSALELIRSNIAKHGYHVYVVSGGGPLPRYAYTIGLREQFGVELVFAGALVFSAAEIGRVFDAVIAGMKVKKVKVDLGKLTVSVDSLGSFTLQKVDLSWGKELMLGALDFYGVSEVEALQVVPDDGHWTLDIPDLAKQWSPSTEPAWQWLKEPWTFQVSSGSLATTNIAALRGERVTEAARWEDEQWELFAGAGPDVPKDEVRVAPLGTLLALDPTLSVVTMLDVGRALWRDPDDGDWQRWGW